MSNISDDASVSIVLADYAAADVINKINILGGSWQITRILPETGMSAPQSVVVVIEVPPAHVNEQFALSIFLVDDAGDILQMPGAPGQSQALRISQLVKIDEPAFVGANVPRGIMPSHTQAVLNFPGGLALQPGRMYHWQVEIDGTADPHWRAAFFVASANPGPVMG